MKLEENLGTVQKAIEDAAGRVAHRTKSEKEKLQNEHWRM